MTSSIEGFEPSILTNLPSAVIDVMQVIVAYWVNRSRHQPPYKISFTWLPCKHGNCDTSTIKSIFIVSISLSYLVSMSLVVSRIYVLSYLVFLVVSRISCRISHLFSLSRLHIIQASWVAVTALPHCRGNASGAALLTVSSSFDASAEWLLAQPINYPSLLKGCLTVDCCPESPS